MTIRGKLLASEDFSKPLAPFTGTPKGFASGFFGWRYNVGTHGGAWELADGVFHGAAIEEAQHPATASYGLDFKNVVIQCELRMDDRPLAGRMGHYMMVRTTGLDGYVCSLGLGGNGFRIEKDDIHGNGKHVQKDQSDEGPEVLVPLGSYKMPIKFGEWQKVVIEILGEEMVGTVQGHRLTGSHPLIGSEKHSIMFVFGAAADVRNFKVWEAEPNPDWAKNKAAIQAETKGFPLR